MPKNRTEPMPSNDRHYGLAALLVCAGLAVAVVLGLLGAPGPGILSLSTAFLVGGVAVMVVATGLLYLFLTHRQDVARLQERVAALSVMAQRLHQEEETSHRAQRTRLERLESTVPRRDDVESLRQRVGDLDGREQALENRVSQLPADVTRQQAEAWQKDLAILRRDLDTLASAHNRESVRIDQRTEIMRQQMETVEDALLRVWDGLSNVNAEALISIKQRLDDAEAEIARLRDRSGATPIQDVVVERLRQRLDLLDDHVRDLDAVRRAHDQALAATHEATRVLGARLDAVPRDEKLWLEVQRLMIDLRQVEELRRREEHFRHEVEGFQNKLAEDHARIEDHFTRLTTLQGLIEATRAELVQLRQQLQRTEEDADAQRSIPVSRLSSPQASASQTAQPEGDELKLIEGIGEVFQERLRADGILTFDDLREAYPDEVAAAVGTTPQRVRQWQDMAELMRVPGIGAQFAEVLVLSGIRSIQQLASMRPEDVVALVEARAARRRVRITREHFDRSTIESWVLAARHATVQPAPGPGLEPPRPPGPGLPDPSPLGPKP